MRKTFSKIICTFLAAVVILAGCGQKYEKETDVMSSGPDIGMISTPSGSAVRIIEAAGGIDSWTKINQLQLDCVVAFFQPDDSFYLTEQRYEVYPWSNSVQISSVEPKGNFVWLLSKGQFSVLKGSERFDDFPIALEGRNLAELVLNIVTAPVYFLDSSVDFDMETTPVKIQGQWYYPMNRKSINDKFMSDAYFYQNRDNNRIDMIWFPHMNRTNSLMVRGYEYQAVEKNGVHVPTNIEIFSTDSRGEPIKRLVRINCRTIDRIK